MLGDFDALFLDLEPLLFQLDGNERIVDGTEELSVLPSGNGELDLFRFQPLAKALGFLPLLFFTVLDCRTLVLETVEVLPGC